MKRALVLGVVIVAAACGGKTYGPRLEPSKNTARVPLGDPVDPAKKAHMSTIASLRDRAVGPVLTRSDKGALAAYIAGAPSGTRPVIASALDGTGSPKGQARVVAQAPPDTSTLIARSLADGYLLAWTSLTDRGESLTVIGVSDTSEARGNAIELARTADHIVWVEIVETPRGAVCVWAEEPPNGSANVLAQALDSNGKPRGVPSRVLRGATSWQAVAFHEGVALAIVAGGALSLTRLDTEGRVTGEAMPISKTVGADMDLVRAGKDSVAFAWTDRRRSDPQVVIAGVDGGGKLIAPHDGLVDAGASSLVAIAPGDNGALVLWEPSHKRERQLRRVNVASMTDAAAQLATKTTLELTGGAAIEARQRADGWGLVVTTKACVEQKDKAPACGAPAPTFVRLDASLAVVQTEAFVQGPAVSLAWSLDCGGGSCLALAAGPDSPTVVYAIDLSSRASTNVAPVAHALPDDAPRLSSASTLGGGLQVADIAFARAGDATVVASIVSTGADEKTHEEKTALRVTPIAAGKALPAVTLSTKALAVGGVAMAAGPGAKEATLVYVAKEGGGARVHVARVDDNGARRSDTTLAGGAKGDASDVSIVAVDGGFVIAWVDTRDGNGEVYAERLGNDLTSGPAVRVTNAPGDATDTALASSGANVILAWADPRESPHDGFADIYAVTLSARDGKPLAKEARVLSTAAHSRSPSLARTASGVALAWIEEAPANAASEEAKGAMFALLDEKAHPVRDPIKLRLRDEGIATSITLDADPASRLLHAVIARVSQDELWLDAARIPLDAGGSVDSFPLVALDGPSSLDVALALRNEELVYSDAGGDAPTEARIRRGLLAWKK